MNTQEIIEWRIIPSNRPSHQIPIKIINKPGVHPIKSCTKERLSAIKVQKQDIALDLGCGCGVFGLYISLAGAQHVTLTEIDPSSLECAKENAQINNLTNLEFLTGDFFEPVKDQRFDLMVANLPQTPGPSCFRSDKWGGQEGADHLLRLAEEAPSYLRPNGRLYFFHIGLANPEGVIQAFQKQFDLKTVYEARRFFDPAEYEIYLPGLFDYLLDLKQQGRAEFAKEENKWYFQTKFYCSQLKTSR